MENYVRYLSRIEKKIIEKFEIGLKETNFKLYPHYKYGNGERLFVREIDLCITDNEDYPIAIIEIKEKLDDYIIAREKEIVIALTKKLRTRFAIITDSENLYLYDFSLERQSFEKITFDELITSLKFQDDSNYVNLIIEHIRKQVQESKNAIIKDLNELITDDCIEWNNNTFSFKNETEIIRKLFPIDTNKRKICRYTTLTTLFNMLQNNSLRMFGIAGMNDSSEVNFFEKSIYQDQDIPLNQEINRKFISSCCSSDNRDKLTFYRLYADDGKGVCLVFDVKQNPKFLLKKVIYLNEYDAILDFLRDFIIFVNSKTGGTFKFKTLHDWAHFIKQNN